MSPRLRQDGFADERFGARIQAKPVKKAEPAVSVKPLDWGERVLDTGDAHCRGCKSSVAHLEVQVGLLSFPLCQHCGRDLLNDLKALLCASTMRGEGRAS
jgi:hypothetical protein